MYYLYVIKSEKDNQLYFGFTGDLKRRFSEHVEGKSFATKGRRPWRLAYYEAYNSEQDARNREKQLKHYARAWAILKRRITRSISNS